MELPNEDASLLLIASENVHLKLKRNRSVVHEINQSRKQYRLYHRMFRRLKADWKWVFQYFRIDTETFIYIWEKM